MQKYLATKDKLSTQESKLSMQIKYANIFFFCFFSKFEV